MSKIKPGGEFPPEFHEWLRANKVPKRVRRDPETLQQHFQEWKKINTPRKRSLFGLPKINLDLGTIVDQVRTVSELLQTLHQAGALIRPQKKNQDELL
ncbi:MULTISPECIES: hypothetical protein [Brevibacillus]|jgi:hypothetical protein|uniref:Uncharacterized protein n=1 Tax=Brevibacillus thermoruber TaxID=33942 RepID=A0A9X3Z2T9_9BACL|nr:MULTISPECIES: hypothetical protein [Brevibacillus]MDA5107960.1 hypothetical protein [Brevibacillus thermoruber]TRY26591.1 hypothetical protein FOI68_06880 [Brevibacillus sp. LEMMJ03]UYZ15266.1 hypothetical protein A6764_10205 [Brevibacillus sp. WF146]